MDWRTDTENGKQMGRINEDGIDIQAWRDTYEPPWRVVYDRFYFNLQEMAERLLIYPTDVRHKAEAIDGMEKLIDEIVDTIHDVKEGR